MVPRDKSNPVTSKKAGELTTANATSPRAPAYVHVPVQPSANGREPRQLYDMSRGPDLLCSPTSATQRTRFQNPDPGKLGGVFTALGYDFFYNGM